MGRLRSCYGVHRKSPVPLHACIGIGLLCWAVIISDDHGGRGRSRSGNRSAGARAVTFRRRTLRGRGALGVQAGAIELVGGADVHMAAVAEIDRIVHMPTVGRSFGFGHIALLFSDGPFRHWNIYHRGMALVKQLCITYASQKKTIVYGQRMPKKNEIKENMYI
jgi:hypothetical protein